MSSDPKSRALIILDYSQGDDVLEDSFFDLESFSKQVILLIDAFNSYKRGVIHAVRRIRSTGSKVICLVTVTYHWYMDDTTETFIQTLKKYSNLLFLLPSLHDICYSDDEDNGNVLLWQVAFTLYSNNYGQSQDAKYCVKNLFCSGEIILADEAPAYPPSTAQEAMYNIISGRVFGWNLFLQRAKWLLVRITADPTVGMEEIECAMSLLREAVHPQAMIAWKVVHCKYQRGRVHLVVVAGGIEVLDVFE